MDSGDPGTTQRRIGPYTVLRRLGEGGMGVVHLARSADGRAVALKVMRHKLAGSEEFRRRFRKEAEAARRVARWCTAPVLDAAMDGTLAYLVTEYVDGPDLAAVVTTRGPMAGADLEALAVGVAVALTAIHAAGVVHRDLKPSNILLSQVGPRVIDFGIAQLAEVGGTGSTTRSIIGTPAYMSPEQARGERVTTASDVFSWGSVVAYAGTGRAPFGGGGMDEVRHRVINYAPDLDGLDEELRALVERALDKNPARRPSAQRLIDRMLGRERTDVETAALAVGEMWTPPSRVMAGQATAGPGRTGSATASPHPHAALEAAHPPSEAGTGESARPRRRPKWPRVVTAAGVALVVVAAVVIALVLRPWEPRGVPAGTTEAVLDGKVGEFPVRVQIDSLIRDGTTVQLKWTVINKGAKGQFWVPQAAFGTGGLDFTMSGVNLVPPGIHAPFQPASKDGRCRCSEFGVHYTINPGESARLYAIYQDVPETVGWVDVDFPHVGRLERIAISPA
ncbi:serine/threonine-protein kinase [Sphaerisporangium dianthi]|uniref:Serine/threonine-protein kinase n=1 Tax=Sphaerisporangium dianthi TaxID=1436120 RepID=A0ABV9CHP7_9ACTN